MSLNIKELILFPRNNTIANNVCGAVKCSISSHYHKFNKMNLSKNHSQIIKIAIIVYLLVPFSCSFGDEPSCSGGGWAEETKVESIGILVGSITQDRYFSGEQFTSYENSVMSIHDLELEFLATQETPPTNSQFLISSAIASPGPTFVQLKR